MFKFKIEDESGRLYVTCFDPIAKDLMLDLESTNEFFFKIRVVLKTITSEGSTRTAQPNYIVSKYERVNKKEEPSPIPCLSSNAPCLSTNKCITHAPSVQQSVPTVTPQIENSPLKDTSPLKENLVKPSKRKTHKPKKEKF